MKITLEVNTDGDLQEFTTSLTESQLGYFCSIDPDLELDEEETTVLSKITTQIYKNELDLKALPSLEPDFLADLVGKLLVECSIEHLIREKLMEVVEKKKRRLLHRENVTYRPLGDNDVINFIADFK